MGRCKGRNKKLSLGKMKVGLIAALALIINSIDCVKTLPEFANELHDTVASFLPVHDLHKMAYTFKAFKDPATAAIKDQLKSSSTWLYTHEDYGGIYYHPNSYKNSWATIVSPGDYLDTSIAPAIDSSTVKFRNSGSESTPIIVFSMTNNLYFYNALHPEKIMAQKSNLEESSVVIATGRLGADRMSTVVDIYSHEDPDVPGAFYYTCTFNRQ